MDKKHNVDDILEEIKRRKSKEQKPAAQPHHTAEPPAARPERPAAPPPSSGTASGRSSPDPVAEENRQQNIEHTQLFSIPDRQTATPSPPAKEREDGFQFVMPQVEKVSRAEKPARNPLDVDSHARSISDKAKIRRKQRGSTLFSPPPPAQQSTPPSAPDPGAKVIDFSAFRPPAEVLQGDASSPPTHKDTPAAQHTRVLTRAELARSREFKLEEIQRLDFGAVADDPQYYEYEDDDYQDDDYIPSAPPLDHGEYNSLTDRNAVAKDIAHVKLWLVIRCLLTGILTGILYYLTFVGAEGSTLRFIDAFLPESSMRMYMLGFVGLSVAVALVCSSTVGGGLISLFKMRANSDTLVSLALLAAIGQCIAGAVRPETVDPTTLGIYACVASLAMFFNALGKTTMISRIQANFKIISSDRKKRAVLPVESDEFARRFVHDNSRRPTVAYSVEAGFFTDFLGLSYSDKYDVGINRGVAPICLIGSLVVGMLTYLLTGNSPTALAAITAILCVAATLSSTFIENIPLGKLTKKLAPQGGMVSGNKAVEDFCDTKAVVLRELDLFPAGHIQLHGIKAYSHGRIDEAILDAASVICSTDSALAPVFLEMIGGNKKLLKKVDNLVYENGMGISAWVNSRRVLIGNQQLMLNHGISLPQDSYEEKYASEHGEPLYLSNSGEVSAQFVVSYHIDEELAVALDHLAVREKKLIIHTVDPNITAYKLWELYGYPEDSIEIMPADAHAPYKAMTEPRETAIAEIVYTGKASVMVRALLACMNARASILAATVIQLVQIILGYGLIAFISFLGAMSTLNVMQLTIYQLFWFAAIYIVQKVRSS